MLQVRLNERVRICQIVLDAVWLYLREVAFLTVVALLMRRIDV